MTENPPIIPGPGVNIDTRKLISIFRKNWLMLVAILFITNVSAYLYVRYTKPLYQSRSELKLDIKSEASSLGLAILNTENLNTNSISSEIELLKSRLFLGKVVDALDLELSVYAYGKMLVDERYPSPPFAIEYVIKDDAIYDLTIDLSPAGPDNFSLSYRLRGQRYGGEYSYGTSYSTPHLTFKIRDLHGDTYNPDGYFFRINSRENLINYLSENLEVLPINPGANIIGVRFTDFNRYKARDMVAAIDTIYLDYTIQQKKQANNQKISFLDEQIMVNNNRLDDLEAYFEDFTIANRSVDMDESIRNTIQLLNQIDSARLDLRAKLEDYRLIRTLILNDSIQYTYLYSVKGMPPSFSTALQDYLQLKQDMDRFSSYSENTRALRLKQRELNTSREKLVTYLNLQEKDLLQQLADYARERNEVEESFARLPSQSNQLSKQRRYYNLYESFNLSLLQKKAELEIAQAGTVTDFKILSPASSPSAPIAPDKLLVHGIGFTSGVVIIFLYVLIAYVGDTKIHSVRDIESRSNISVIASIPRYTDENLRQTEMIVARNPRSVLTEALRTLRTNLEFIDTSDDKKIISITSTVPGEGKTFCAVNLAAVLSLTGSKVIVLDMDMRKPRIHSSFGDHEHSMGLSTFLIKKHTPEEVIRSTSLDNLFYIPAGPIPPNPSELIVSGSFDHLLEDLRKKYDYIILDTPPVGLVTDGMLTMRKANLTLYVMRADYSEVAFLDHIEKTKTNSRASNLYILLNSVKSPLSYGYGKRGYYYAHKGKASV